MLEENNRGYREQKPDLEVTPGSICRSYDFSIVIQRWAGALIDLIVVAAILIVPFKILGDEDYRSLFFVLVFLSAIYFILTEGLTGRSLGKLITQTVVVNEQGKHPGLWKGFLRTLIRLIELNPFLIGGLPAGVAIITSKKKQRFGDMLAKTYVLRNKDLQKISASAGITLIR